VQRPESRYVTTNKNQDWKDRGGDGHGGNLLSYDIVAPGPITSVVPRLCAGCGAHFWPCPDPRCSGRGTFERINENTYRAWAATDGDPNVTVAWDVNYSENVEVPCSSPGASLELDPPSAVDLRSGRPKDDPVEARLKAETYVTVPLTLRNGDAGSSRAVVEGSTVRLVFGQGEFHFAWKHFVNMNEERFFNWLAIDGEAHPLALEAGSVEYREVAHGPAGHVPWGDVLPLFAAGRKDRIKVIVNVKTRQRVLEQACVVDADYWRGQVAEVEKTGVTPSRITMKCLGSEALQEVGSRG
jgi:hypothetical protein